MNNENKVKLINLPNISKPKNKYSIVSPLNFNSSKQNIYIASDFHLNHDATFIYKNRGFKNIDDHDNYIYNYISNNISKYGKNKSDIRERVLIYLGDFCFNKDYNINKNIFETKILPYFDSIYIISGNHDNYFFDRILHRMEIPVLPCRLLTEDPSKNIYLLGNMKTISIDDKKYILSHYPLLETPKNIPNICGHCHGNNINCSLFNDNCIASDCSVDCNIRDFNVPIVPFNFIYNYLEYKRKYDKILGQKL